ncbi:MAG: hypothetical protein ACOX8S_02570 [Christensenellales bacterium]|jgi:hypothetical protein
MSDIRYTGKRKADIRFQDGALPHAAGVKTYQVMRACRDLPDESDGFGWTYNHAADIVFWKGRFFVEYLSNPVSEHVPPGQVLICSSESGSDWGFPKTAFPACEFPAAPYKGPNKELLGELAQGVPHHRMGFYAASNGVLLASSFYGICPEPHTNPNNGYGVGRVICRVFEDFNLSPVYFIKFNEAGGYNRENAGDVFPYYKQSGDKELIAACDELLENDLVMQQWWEEERFDKSFVAGGASALSYYSAADGSIVGVYKNGLTRVSRDGGKSWSKLAENPSIETATGKVWGQKTSDGKYALLYNPTTNGQHRWPIAIVTGDDGYEFGGLSAVTSEVSPQRYAGLMKNLGPQYLRGICEGNPEAPDGNIWIAYSNNKEDIWVSCVPVPVRSCENSDEISDVLPEDFDKWNIYSPKWAPVRAAKDGISLKDKDRYDRAIAERALPESESFSLRAKVRVDEKSSDNILLIELCDDKGAAPVSMHFAGDGNVHIKSGGRAQARCAYSEGKLYEVMISGDCRMNDSRFTISDGETGREIFSAAYKFDQSVHSVQRAVFATKRRFTLRDLESNGHDGLIGDLPDSDSQTEKGSYTIAAFQFKKLGGQR